MTEQLKSLDLAAGYGGTIRGPGVQVPAYEADPWHKYADRLIDRLAEAVANAAACELFVDDGGPLIFGVRPGLVRNGDTLYTFAGCTAALTDDATNYILLTAANLAAGNTVTVNQTGFPLQSVTPHIPLGTIVAADGVYTHDNISQTPRQRSMLSIGQAMTAASANTLVAGSASNADALHVHGLAGLDAGVRLLMPVLVLEATDDEDGTGTFSIQASYPYAGGPMPVTYRVRAWISATMYGAPAAQTDFSILTGTQLREIAANADYEAISDADGLVVMNVEAADGSYYVMAEVDGAIYAAEITITGN